MNSAQISSHIREIGVVPIVRTTDAGAALHAVEAILAGGISCVEITMTVDGAIKALESVADRHGDSVLLGAGTVLDPETARICMLAGAQFFVTPSLNLKTVEMVKRYSKAVFPGALTPTEIVAAWEAGADGVKVFPCSAMGGAKYIKALKGPFPHIDLVPTGGVNLDTIGEFFAAGSTAVGVGSELVDTKAIGAGHYHVITERAVKFREAAVAARHS
ncbi:MAG TPA: bifunctional 4-hydroxy-2-oxoglutarate aldolase/2-dehydro-3-deoxy-phosphogluconate aldolase [Bryobacteraceae bacterium]|jgi:2-dehydro-3-deoxyphosphogluconate aldolase/(4S)-4-hydroxy-2-oxoglutarate aldolase|nr:bifunctional 4-hydroxy-2-oxoglutarate aldolase/2-dehydro-3-deoxy-phosphogluconate aldolase [Bryobacteraceae bacterium]